METRICARCGESKPLDQYQRDASKPLGRAYGCKACKNKNTVVRYEDAPGTKTCRRCKERKHLTDFSVHSKASDGRQSWCKTCQNDLRAARYRLHAEQENARHRSAYASNPDKQLDRTLRKRYGITLAEFNAMREAQAGRCGLCDSDAGRLVVDHCHRTGRVRKLLCYRCNILVGYVEGRPDLIDKALEYASSRQLESGHGSPRCCSR